MRIALISRTLRLGGVERQVSLLARGLASKGEDVHVVTVAGGGALEDDLANEDVPCHLGSAPSHPGQLYALRRTLRGLQPDIVYSFHVNANLMAALGTPRRTPLLWGLRATLPEFVVDAGTAKRLGLRRRRLQWRLQAPLSRRPIRLIANAAAVRNDYLRLGVRGDIDIIPNGIDTDRFAPSLHSRAHWREQLGIPQNAYVIGVVGRYSHKKGQDRLLPAMAALGATPADRPLTFLFAGDDFDGPGAAEFRSSLQPLVDQGLAVIAGLIQDMPGLYNAMDALCLPSRYGEGFPNVVGEAMACGVLPIVAEVGDSATVVGDSGFILPQTNLEPKLERLFRQVVANSSDSSGISSSQRRQRVQESFSPMSMVDRTLEILRQVGLHDSQLD